MTSANMTLAELAQRIETLNPFYSSATDMNGERIAVLSTYPTNSRQADGTLKQYETGDSLSLLVKPGTELNDLVNADANKRTHNYLTRNAAENNFGRKADAGMVVYYIVRKSTGRVLAVVYTDSTFAMAPRAAWKSQRGYDTVSIALTHMHTHHAVTALDAASGY